MQYKYIFLFWDKLYIKTSAGAMKKKTFGNSAEN